MPAPTQQVYNNAPDYDLAPALVPGLRAERHHGVISLIIGDQELILRPRDRAHLARIAQRVGAEVHLPFTLTLVLAWIVRRTIVPSHDLLQVLAEIAFVWTPDSWLASVMDDMEVQTAIDTQMATGYADFGMHAPVANWDRARWLVGLAESLWTVRGPAALPMTRMVMLSGRPSMVPLETLLNRRGSLQMLAMLGATPSALSSITLPIAGQMSRSQLWIEWSALISGPGDPPAVLRPAGLGQCDTQLNFRDTPLTIDAEDSIRQRWHDQEKPPTADLAALVYAAQQVATESPDSFAGMPSRDQMEALRYSASMALLKCDRPVPRFLGKVLDVRLPIDVLPEARQWPIGMLRVVPAPTGLWVAVHDQSRTSRVAFWWPAAQETLMQTPFIIQPVLWPLLHALCASLWHDLCADAEIIEVTSERIYRPERAMPRNSSERSIRLPVKIYQASWGNRDDREALRRAHVVGSFYRRLPTGWQNRTVTRATQQRRQDAANRAAEHGAPPPPDGYTFVAPQVRGIGDVEGAPAPIRVHAEGLFQLALGLQQVREHDDSDL